MAEVNPPGFLQELTTHPALLFLRAFGMVFASEGVGFFNGDNDLKVSQSASTGMTVDVAKGICCVQGDDATDEGIYVPLYNDAVVTKTIAASDVTQDRKDLIVARVKDNFHGVAGNVWLIDVVQGALGLPPSEPALPATALKLAVVSVPHGLTTVLNVNVTDSRRKAALAMSSAVGARVYLTANESIPDGGKVIPWDAAENDTDGMWSGGSPTRLTIQKPGVYVVSTTVAFTGDIGGTKREVYIQKNGVKRSRGRTTRDATGKFNSGISEDLSAPSPMEKCVVGDYFEVYADQNKGSAIDMVSGVGVSHFSAWRIGL